MYNIDFKNLKCFIFDIDGVLLDHISNNRHEWINNADKDLNIPKDTLEKIHKNVSEWKNISLGKSELKDYLDNFVKDENIRRTTSRQIMHYFVKHDTHIRQYMLNEIVKIKQKGYKICIGTHQAPEKGSRLWSIEKLNTYFDNYITSYDIGFLKSEIGFYSSVEKMLNFKSNELILIDDTQKNIDTAINAGWNAYLYTTFEDIKSDLFLKLKQL